MVFGWNGNDGELTVCNFRAEVVIGDVNMARAWPHLVGVGYVHCGFFLFMDSGVEGVGAWYVKAAVAEFMDQVHRALCISRCSRQSH